MKSSCAKRPKNYESNKKMNEELIEKLNGENERLSNENERLRQELAAERQARESAEADCGELSRLLVSSQQRLAEELLSQEWVSDQQQQYHLRKSAITLIEAVGEKCKVNGEITLQISASELLAILQQPKDKE